MVNGFGGFESSFQSPQFKYERSLVTSLLDAGLATRLQRISDVPAYGAGVAARDRALRSLFYLPGLEPIQSAVSIYAQRLVTTSWIMEGPSKTAHYYWTRFHQANFGQGIDDFHQKFVLDYLCTDNGAFVELIGDAPPLRRNGRIVYNLETGEPVPDATQPMQGPIKGIANLDSLRCTRTGDPHFPVIYDDLEGRRHKIHATRVWMVTDMPSADERRYGVGFCALSRAVSVAQRLYKWGQMASEMMDDFPSSGILVVRQMAKVLFDQQMRAYEAGRQMKEQEFYHALITLFFQGKDGGVELVPFRQVWSSFDDQKFSNVMIDLVAMCFNLDRQELAPLASTTLGSGAQSGTLRKTSRGKGVHAVLAHLERMYNAVTPQSISFHFDYTDLDEDLQAAQLAQLKANYLLSLYTASKPDSNVSIDTTTVTTPTVSPNTVSKGAITYEELRYLLVKEGVIPRELLRQEENLRPDWQRFDDVTMKALRRYGPPILLNNRGRIVPPIELGITHAA